MCPCQFSSVQINFIVAKLLGTERQGAPQADQLGPFAVVAVVSGVLVGKAHVRTAVVFTNSK